MFSGPSTGLVGVPVTLSVSPNSTVTDTVTLSDGGAGGTFSPSATLTFTNSSATQHPTYTPSATGTKTITATSTAGGAVSGSPISLSVAAISYTLSGASSGFDGVPITLTVTPSGAATNTVTLSDGSGGGLSPIGHAYIQRVQLASKSDVHAGVDRNEKRHCDFSRRRDGHRISALDFCGSRRLHRHGREHRLRRQLDRVHGDAIGCDNGHDDVLGRQRSGAARSVLRLP